MTWLMNNLSTIIVCIVLIAVVVLIINKMIKDKKKGKSSCGCGCSNCAMAGKCAVIFFIKTIKYSVNSIDNYGVKVYNILRQLIVKGVND